MTRKLRFLATASVLSIGLTAVPSMAQDASTAEELERSEEIIVTGSRIKQDPAKSPLPLQIIGQEELLREGINSPEQLISFLSTNGNGSDNLAANSDVTAGAQRGTNGLSAANLRGQGSASTLVLLNGRRVAAHGLTGSAVDVNQIPFAAIERVEVLKDGASAIYGTDAIGGVINFITKTDYQGLTLTGFTDITEEGDANIYRVSATAGYGDIDSQGFNIMGAVSYSKNQVLFGSDRDFVNGNQPERGLSIDTRGTPIATIMANGTNAIFAPAGSLLAGTSAPTGGVNILNIPGGAGCETMDGGMAYDWELWAAPNNRFACAWDTGRAAVLQQPLQTLTYYGRASAKLGNHEIYAEVTGSDADSNKIFSNNQYSGNTTSMPLYFPLNDLTEDTYNEVYNQLVEQFPDIAANYGKPIAYRWRCVACGPREYKTNTKTFRIAGGVDGDITDKWDYRVGGSFARSRVKSTLGTGYHYRGLFPSSASANASGVAGAVSGGIDPRAPTAPGATAPGIVGLLNSGILNPFSLEQSDEALAALEAISAEGTTLYSGEYKVVQFDGSVSGELFELPGGMVQVAAGVDYRKETYTFDGSSAGVLGEPDIFNAAFDNGFAMDGVSRNVKAAYAEVLVPIFDMLEVTGAVRVDDYSGFGTTTNPKISAKFTPTDWLMFRGSYNTGFRVPTFNQIFNGVLESPVASASYGDPRNCPDGLVANAPAGSNCVAFVSGDVVTLGGGNVNLGPETSEQYSVGVVLQPSRHFMASVDFWSINVEDVIGSLSIQQLLANSELYPDRIIRDASGEVTALDLRNDNIGSRRTQGIEVSLRGNIDLGGGTLAAGLDGTYLVKKKERFLPDMPWEKKIGVFSYTGDLGLRWKHNAFINWSNETFNVSLSQIFRNGYKNNDSIPGSADRPQFNVRVKDYVIYNLSAGVRINEGMKLTAGIKNLFDKDPPFAITYDSGTGAGSSWEPRVADPRGRSFTLLAEVKF